MAKKYHIATIDVLVETESDVEACDAISEGLRPLLKVHAENPEHTAWIDWRYHGDSFGRTWPFPEEHSGEGFEYGEKTEDAETAAKAQGWRLDPDGAFRNDAERLDDGSLASFWYDGDWTFLCGEAGIDHVE